VSLLLEEGEKVKLVVPLLPEPISVVLLACPWPRATCNKIRDKTIPKLPCILLSVHIMAVEANERKKKSDADVSNIKVMCSQPFFMPTLPWFL
jgi:hypothetical protein